MTKSFYNILFEHNLALKVALEYSAKYIGKSMFTVIHNSKSYTGRIDEFQVEPLGLKGAEISVISKFRGLENRTELMKAGLYKMRLIEFLELNNLTSDFFETYGIVYSTVVPPMVTEINDFLNN